MTVQIEIDETTLAEVDEALRILNENRDDVFQQAFRDLARGKKREALVAGQYAAAYGSKPVRSDEFDVDETQLTEVWDDV